jgi:hypothetical protein
LYARFRQRAVGHAERVATEEHTFVVRNFVGERHAADCGQSHVLRVAGPEVALLVAEATVTSTAVIALAAAGDDVGGDASANPWLAAIRVGHDRPHELMPGIGRMAFRGTVRLHLAAADRRGFNPEQHLAWPRFGNR